MKKLISMLLAVVMAAIGYFGVAYVGLLRSMTPKANRCMRYNSLFLNIKE